MRPNAILLSFGEALSVTELHDLLNMNQPFSQLRGAQGMASPANGFGLKSAHS